jgi:16S rRNA (cytosine967-C5)-methyltransferase
MAQTFSAGRLKNGLNAPPPMSPHRHDHPAPCPRAAALAVLDHQEMDHLTLDRVLDDQAAATAALSRRDRSLFNQLVYGVLRWRSRLDAVIGAHANRPVNQITPTIRNILRIGLFQILMMDRIPASAAVNTAVDLVRRCGSPRSAGFVNAVLRNALRHPKRSGIPDAHLSPSVHLAAAKSFPLWLIDRWIDRFGLSAAGRLCDAINTVPPITLRCNHLKNSPMELLAALTAQVGQVNLLEGVPGALNIIGPRLPIAEMSAFGQGRFAVQDGAAQLVSLLLDPQPGECILDACAGLGGKTTHLAQLMQNFGDLVAVDNVPAKLACLEKEARRLGIGIIHTRALDLEGLAADAALPRFDRILLDAPCTGLGVLRRNPDAKWSSRAPDIARCARRQKRFLERVAALVRTGGVLVFAVCSMEPEENEEVIVHFLKKHPEFAIDERQSIEVDGVASYLNADGFLRTAPHLHGLDGFFAARLRRMG